MAMIAGADDLKTTLGSPVVVGLHGLGQTPGEAGRVLLDADDAVVPRRIVGVGRQRRRQARDDLVEQLIGRGVAQIGEVEHRAVLQIRRRHEVVDEQQRVGDPQRVGTPRARPHLGVEIPVIPSDVRSRFRPGL